MDLYPRTPQLFISKGAISPATPSDAETPPSSSATAAAATAESTKAPSPSFVLRGHVEAVSVVRFSSFTPSDNRGGGGVGGESILYSGSTSGELRAWDLSTRRTVACHQAHPRGILSIVPLHSDKVITQGKDGYVRWWSVASDFRVEASLQTCCCSFGRLCYSEELGVIASPCQDPKTVNLFDCHTGALVRTFNTKAHAGMAMSLSWVRPGPSDCEPHLHCCNPPQFLAGVFEDGRMYLWELRGGDDPVLVESLHSEPATCLDFCGLRGASGSAAGDVPVFDLSQQQPSLSCRVLSRLKLGNGSKKPGINDLRVRKMDGKVFATAGWDHRVRVWAWRKSRPLAVLRFHVASVTSVDFSPVSRSTLASASQDTRIAIWNIY